MKAGGPATRVRTAMEQGTETERVWHEMHGRLLSYIRRHVDADDDAEDILQDVFVRIHTHLADVNDAGSVTAWVYQITRNAVTDYYRKRATAARALAGIADNADRTGEPADGPDVTREAVDDFANCLEPLMSELPEHYREALSLTELGGMTQKEAAGRLGLSVSGMKARVQRGRGKLKEVILDCCNVELDRRGGLVDYERRERDSCDACDCD